MADEDNEFDELEDGEGKGKGKLFLIIGIVVLVLMGAAGAFFLLSGDEEVADGEDAKATEEIVVEEDQEERVAKYYAVPKEKEPGMVLILNPGTKFKQVQVSFRIFTYSPALTDYLVKNDPLIRHHILNTLSLQDSKLFLSRKGREKTQAALKDMLVKLLANSKNKEEQKLSKKVEAVYFSNFILQ